MTNTRFICHVLTPPQKYGKFNVGSRPMRIREYTAMNNNIQLLDETEQNIVIYSWRADQLFADAEGSGK